jgi:hypothetical protein
MFTYTSADLLTNVKSKAAMPDSQITFTDTRILDIANERIRSKILPAVLSTREDYYLTYIDYATPALSYSIPSDAIGMKLSRVAFLDDGGTEWPCIRVATPLEAYESSEYFYIRKNTIYFDQMPTRTVRLYYHSRPTKLVATTSAMQIVSISGLDIEVSSVPVGFVAGDSIIGVGGSPGFETLMPANVIANIASTTLTMTSALPSSLAVGDWLSDEGMSPVVQVPYECLSSLEWFVASTIMKAQDDAQGATLADQEAVSALKEAIQILQPRIDGAAQKIVKRDSNLRESADGIFNSGVWVR